MMTLWRKLICGNPRKLWVRYCFGISLIILLLLGSHQAHVQALKLGAQDAELIDVSGRQRMLSQRIAGLSIHLDDPVQRPHYEPPVRTAIAAFEAAHTRLIAAADGFPAAARVYAVDKSSGLDRQSRNFILIVKSALEKVPGDPEFHTVLSSIEAVAYTSLLTELDAAVQGFRTGAQSRVAQLQRIQQTAFFGALGLLALEVLLIFLPAQLAVNNALNLRKAQTRRLEEKNKDLEIMAGELDRAAHFDQLTGLANRTRLLDTLNAHLTSADQHERPLCVLHIDLDRFKEINDTLGHPFGDAVLQRVADRMVTRTRSADLVARVGGDEFVIVGRFERATVEADVAALADDLINAIIVPMKIEDESCRVGASIGFVIAEGSGASADELIANADIALYEAKRAGKGQAMRFTPEMRALLVLRHTIIQELEQGLKRGEFVPFFQPKVCLKSGQLTGFEVLIRWQHPSRGLLLPHDFIELAEETGLVEAIDTHTIHGALDALQTLRSGGWHVPGIALNAAGISLRNKAYALRLAEAVSSRGLSPGDIHVEIVESILISDDRDPSLVTLRHLRELGFQIDIDDFGTGYASLSMLSKLELNAIKIDKGLVTKLEEPRARQIIEAIVGLAKGMGLEVVVEGVETPAQYNQLLKLGCDTAQGFGIGRPMTFEAVPSWLENYGARPSALGGGSVT